MGKNQVEDEDVSFLVQEKRRWQGTPVWGILLAFLQIAVVLVIFPALMKLIWNYFYSLGHPFYVGMFVFIGVHIFSLTVSNLMMVCIYKVKHPFFEQYRSEPDRKFPWEEDSSKWNSLLRRNVLLLVLNILVFAPFMGYMITPDLDNVPTRHDLDSWPTLWEIVWQVVFCSFCEDFMFYCTHRTLHTRWCYKHIHKRHHEYAQPVSIGGEFSHPLEFLFGNVLPFYLGIILLDSKMHQITVLVWAIYRVFESGDAHSGYDFPWSPYRLVPFSATARYHNYHHAHSKGNYSTFFSIWDTVFGTNKSYYAHLKKLREAKKDD